MMSIDSYGCRLSGGTHALYTGYVASVGGVQVREVMTHGRLEVSFAFQAWVP